MRIIMCVTGAMMASATVAVAAVNAVANPVRVEAPLERPVLVSGGAVLEMSGYNPRYWAGTNILAHQMMTFKDHPVGYYISGVVGSVESEEADQRVLMTLEAAPEARIVMRLGIHEPREWLEAHPDDRVVTETGAVLNVGSLASDAFWDYSTEYSVRHVLHSEAASYRDRVIAYVNFMQNEGTAANFTQGWLSDQSPVMVAAWRAFLTEAYGSDAALQEAWDNPAATLAEALPPTDQLRGATHVVDGIPFWQTGGENAMLRDWFRCVRALFHRRTRQVVEAMDEACGSRVPILIDSLKQPMQGWTIHEYFGLNVSMKSHGYETMAACGSSDVAPLLDMPSLGGLITPHDYQGRGMGGIFEPEGAADSCVVRGKLYLCEMDTRSYLTTHRESAPARSLAEFEAITWRNLATAISRGWWPYWMDLYVDWFSDPVMQPTLKRQIEVYNAASHWPHEDEPCIAVVIDDTAAEATNGGGRYPFLAVSEQIRLEISRCGVPYRIYLLKDLALERMPKHKVWYFPNLFHVTPEKAALVGRVKTNGNVLVWGPGSGIHDGAAISTESATALTGFSFELMQANYIRRALWLGGHRLTDGIAGATFGDSLSYGPQLYPADGTPLAWAWTQQSWNMNAVCVKSMDNWVSIFTSALPLPAAFWRNAAREAKAHVWSETDDILVASRQIVGLHSVVPGKKEILLPGKFTVTDAITGKRLGRNMTRIRFEMKEPGTRVFMLE
ncbi:MAG: hypothetical protein FWF84_04025 [Kiritimatiellaeota bacterium]|nr:hypothetical protein [Kiritimatiellota bacterium]